MDMALLRRLIDGVLLTLYTRYTAKELPALCERLGLPAPSEGSTKHERLVASLKACPDDRLQDVADAVLEQEKLDQAERMALQDVLWLGRHNVQIPSRTRRELARDFDLSAHLGYPDRFMALLGRLWHLDNDPLGGWTATTNSLRTQIERHVIRFPDDWTTEQFFEQLGAFEAPHPRFGYFLESLASSAALPDEPAQRRFVELASTGLHRPRARSKPDEEAGTPVRHGAAGVLAVNGHRAARWSSGCGSAAGRWSPGRSPGGWGRTETSRVRSWGWRMVRVWKTGVVPGDRVTS